MIERLEMVGADSISALHVDSISALEQPTCIDFQRAEIDSAPTGYKYKYNRRSLRLKHYDYSRAGYYFITITAQNREHLFGEIVDGNMVPNVAGKMINELWYEIPNDFDHVALHDFVIMPNHIHGIIEIVGADSISALHMDSISALEQPTCLNPQRVDMESNQRVDMESNQRVDMESNQRVDMESTPTQNNMDSKRAEIDSAPTLSTIMQSFKRHTTLRYIKMVKNGTLPPFHKRIWQRNFYEHVIRDDGDYVRIAEYIENNVITWELDSLNEP